MKLIIAALASGIICAIMDTQFGVTMPEAYYVVTATCYTLCELIFMGKNK